MKLQSFGGLIARNSSMLTPTWTSEVFAELGQEALLAVGNSRSYGDLGLLSNGTMLTSLGLNKFLNFDESSGILECEAGVLLRDIQSIFVRRGWMLPVTPGTGLVTVGGAIAGDVHGKDHHYSGTFGEHVESLTLLRSSGEVFECSKSSNLSLFQATIGGLGLTGFIASAKIRLKRVSGPFIDTDTLSYGNLSEFFAISESTEKEGWQASVSWFDCSTKKAGRGIFTRGNPSEKPFEPESKKLELTVPFTPPISLVNKFSLDLFNATYFAMQKTKTGASVQSYQDFYYPLDGVKNWNRIYGPKGFLQYQSVVPMSVAEAATAEMLDVIRRSGQGSFLAVLKTFADRKPAGLLSFARHGVTLALDFPNRGITTDQLFERLDQIVLQAGGTLNPTKDARMSREMFLSGYPKLGEFLKYRDPAFVSDFSRRVID